MSYGAMFSKLQHHEIFTMVTKFYRAAGGSLDNIDRTALADAITKVEDILEMDHPAYSDRTVLRTIRRSLEPI
jgi:hypothetical protein